MPYIFHSNIIIKPRPDEAFQGDLHLLLAGLYSAQDPQSATKWRCAMLLIGVDTATPPPVLQTGGISRFSTVYGVVAVSHVNGHVLTCRRRGSERYGSGPTSEAKPRHQTASLKHSTCYTLTCPVSQTHERGCGAGGIWTHARAADVAIECHVSTLFVMAGVSVRNGNARRHGAHDSALDVPSKDEVARLRMRELEEENSLLLEKATSASRLSLLPSLSRCTTPSLHSIAQAGWH